LLVGVLAVFLNGRVQRELELASARSAETAEAAARTTKSAEATGTTRSTAAASSTATTLALTTGPAGATGRGILSQDCRGEHQDSECPDRTT
jgi:hypothetical protein